jgi:hypothetical protein
MATDTHLTQKKKQKRYRSRLRRKGLRPPVQIWVPDTRTAGFPAECRNQARMVVRSAQEKPALDFISEIAAWDKT